MSLVLTPQTRSTLAVGDSGTFTKVITEEDVLHFAAASGDFNPVHISEEYARTTRFGRRIAHGVLTAGVISTLLGAVIPGVGTVFVELHVRFLRPVFLGDTIKALGMVSQILNPARVCLMVASTNQEGRDVAIGHAIVIPPEQTRVLG